MLRQRLSWYMTKLNYTRRAILNGRTFHIPHINGLHYTPNEVWMSDVVGGLTSSRDGVFLDCGVNVGQTLLKLKSIRPDCTYIGFEPNPACVHYVQHLIRRNKLQACEIVPAGIAEQNGIATLYSYDESGHDSRGSLRHDRGIDITSTQHVATVSADTIENVIGDRSIGVVKIDVEGLELEVAKALRRLIAQHRPPIIMELLPVYESGNERHARQNEIEELFRSLGYDQLEIMRNADESLIGVEHVETAGVRTDWSRCDYIFAPSEQRDQITASLAA